MIKYNMKYFNENAVKVDSNYSIIYDIDNHRISICECSRCARRQYYTVCVDGITVATRTTESNTLRCALKWLNEHEEPEQNEEPEEEIQKTGVFYRTTIYSKMPYCEPYTLDQTTLKHAKEWVEFETKCAYNSGATIDKYTRIENTWKVERVLQWGEIKSPE